MTVVEREPATSRLWAGVPRAALVMAALTAGSRVAGFARTVIFAGAVGATAFGDLYQTANATPTILFEIVAGGALAGAVVPLVAGASAERVTEVASALLTWTVLLMTALAGIIVAIAPWLITVVTGSASADGTAMLRIFAVQLPLYGVGAVLGGVLHAHRRHTWPVLAPLLSSVVVSLVYLVFGALAADGAPSKGLVAFLAWGTTAGVAVLSLSLIPPVRAIGVTPRPRLRLDAGSWRRFGQLAGASVLLVAAQQALAAGLIRLANDGPAGSVVVFVLAQTVAAMPAAVLAIPLGLAVFPQLSRAAAAGDDAGFDATLARATRLVLLGAGAGVALLVAGAPLIAGLLSSVTAAPLAPAIVASAPGLFGLALSALLGRALMAAGAPGRAAIAVAAGGLVAVPTALLWPAADRVIALGLASSAGLTVTGVGLLVGVAGRRGSHALAGAGRTFLISGVGSVALGWAGLSVAATNKVLAPLLILVIIGVAGVRGQVRRSLW